MNKPTLMTIAAVTALSCAAAAMPPVTMLAPRNARNAASQTSDTKRSRTVPNTVTVMDKVSMPQRVQQPVFTDGLPVIYGSVVSSYADWFVDGNSEQLGYYAFQPESAIRFQPIAIHPNLYVDGGGTYSDSRLHYHLWELYADDGSATGITFHNYYCVVDTETWSFVNVAEYHDDQTNVAFDMTYDPVGDNIYAVQWGPYETNHCDFARVDKLSGEATVIAKLPSMAVLASDNFGMLYAVGTDGVTYYIDKTDGTLTALGASGVMPKYIQSATVDPETNIIYWAAMSEARGGELYRLNTCTGRAELVAQFPGDEEVTGLFIEAARGGLNAPAALRDVTMNYSAGQSHITATVPATAYDGSQLTSSVSVELYIDSQLKGTKQVSPGESVQFDTAVADGNHTVVLRPRNTAGEGPKTIRSQYCGMDVPEAPAQATLTLEGTQATLSWTASTQGLNGGTIDPAQVRYTVTRYPQGEIVAENLAATTFAETLPQGTATYYYTVTARNDLGEGGTVTSNSVFMGNAFTVPYFQPFDTEESLAGFTIINNEEGRGWFWWNNTAQKFQAMASRFNRDTASDNWLILPAIEMHAGSEYRLQFTARVFDTDSPEKFEVTIGNGATVADQTRRLMSAATIKNEQAKSYDVKFKSDGDGTRNIAFHCLSPITAYYLIIDDIRLTETSSAEGPAAVTDLTAQADPQGELKATLNFTLPRTTMSGATLSSISRVEVYRNDDNSPTATITTDLTPGANCTWTDTQAVQGENTYRVSAFTGNNKGQEASVSVFVGYQTPSPVTNAKAVDVDGDNVRISWTAPTKGVNGADLPTDQITYKVLANTGDVIAEGITDTSCTDSRFAGFKGQYFVYYQIHACWGNTQSEGTLTDFIVMGPDLDVPFNESFTEAGLDHSPWTLSTLAGGVTGCWTLADMVANPSATPQDGDGGMAYFKANSLPAGVEARLTSPKVDLFSADHPHLTFWVYIPGGNCREELTVEITHNDNVFTPLSTIDLTGEAGWKCFDIEIPRLHCTESSMVAFRAKSSGYGRNICLDNIAIANSGETPYNTDLEAVNITIPTDWMPGQEGELTVQVYNNGRTTVDNYTVTLYCDGSTVHSTQGTSIAPGETMNYIFKATPEEADRGVTFHFKGGVKATGDQNPDNDMTPERAVTIGQSSVGSVANAAAKVFVSREGITITGADGRDVSVATIGGAVIFSGKASARTTVAATRGLYIVRIGTQAIKIAVP